MTRFPLALLLTLCAAPTQADTLTIDNPTIWRADGLPPFSKEACSADHGRWDPLSKTCVIGAETYTLLTVSHGGTVSLNRGLSKEECEAARMAVRPICRPAGNFCPVSEGDITTAECVR